ncbi:hypothetical protein RF11_04369 [Thelohanellus kitauei]|uniref:Uncharacterized protein n=1 Tax=Thelohanellus kitauei TaxID=669202 RepID=A0A0C2MVS8_THEKT|nr:hypothetical protein RF11_04369 [Thelohanellus kitauei]
MFADLDQIDIAPTMFSEDLQLDDKILDFKFDKFRKCVYYHVKNGIFRKCYGNKEQIAKPPILLIEDITIMGIEFDYMNHDLFYFSKHEIKALNLKSLVKTTVYITKNFIRFLKLDVSNQKMIISYLEKETMVSKISVLTFSATVEKVTFDFEKDIHEIILYHYAVDILSSEGIFEYRVSRKQVKQVSFVFKKRYMTPFQI